MNRHEWEFEYTARDLAKAAKSQQEFRLSRVSWWQGQKKKVMDEIKEAGIEVEESIGSLYSNTSAGMGPQVVVRTDLQRKLTECHKKIEEHTKLAKDYDGWFQVLNGNPESRVKLHHDDWLFFFGK